MRLPDHLKQPLILNRPGGPPAGLALVIRRCRHPKGAADRLDAETIPEGIGKPGHFGRLSSSSLAKNSDAAGRISFARRSSAFSRLRSLICSRSAVEGMSGLRP
jgi:hypothetical protein